MSDRPQNEPVTSPDQRKPVNHRFAYAGGLISAAMLLALLAGDHPNDIEVASVCVIAAFLVLAVVVDWQLRRRGLSRRCRLPRRVRERCGSRLTRDPATDRTSPSSWPGGHRHRRRQASPVPQRSAAMQAEARTRSPTPSLRSFCSSRRAGPCRTPGSVRDGQDTYLAFSRRLVDLRAAPVFPRRGVQTLCTGPPPRPRCRVVRGAAFASC